MIVPERSCTKCGVVKCVDHFYKSKSGTMGRRPSCKDCMAKADSEYAEAQAAKIKVIPLNKLCSKCQVDKPGNEFAKNNAKKCGLQTWCKVCRGRYSTPSHKTPSGIRRRIRRSAVAAANRLQRQGLSAPRAGVLPGVPPAPRAGVLVSVPPTIKLADTKAPGLKYSSPGWFQKNSKTDDKQVSSSLIGHAAS